MPFSFGELVLPAAGIGLAASATAFAVAMVSDQSRTPAFSGAEHLMIFARPVSGGVGKSQARRTSEPSPPLEADDMPVGSITPRDTGGRGDGERRRTETPVRGVFNGKALVETPTGFVLVEPGFRSPQLGTVLAIEPRDGKWVVVTADNLDAAERSMGD